MCFSLQADLVAAGALLPVAVACLREVRAPREILFAALPALFAVHQLVEALVWLGVDGRVGPHVQSAAALGYLVIALPVLPTLLPLSIMLLEPRGARLRLSPFLGVGLVVSAYLMYALLTGPVRVVPHPHALSYETSVRYGTLWAVLYVVAVIGPALLSGYRSIVAFGVLNLLGLVAVSILYVAAFDSLWCLYAALVSTLALVHMRRRRRLPDPHRLQGHLGSTPVTC